VLLRAVVATESRDPVLKFTVSLSKNTSQGIPVPEAADVFHHLKNDEDQSDKG